MSLGFLPSGGRYNYSSCFKQQTGAGCGVRAPSRPGKYYRAQLLVGEGPKKKHMGLCALLHIWGLKRNILGVALFILGVGPQ